MDIKNIEQAIKLIDNNEFGRLKDLLIFEREKAILKSSGKKSSLLNAVKKVIDKCERETLKAVFRDDNNKQFICDGYIMVRWKNEVENLKCFEKKSPNHLWKLPRSLMPHSTIIDSSDDTKIVLKSLDKYIKLYKGKCDIFVPIYIFGRTVDAILLKKLIDIVGVDINHATINKENPRTYITLHTNDTDSIILPLNFQDLEKTIKRTQDFIFKIKNEEK